eukprot:TRINITY_DN2902_c0_g1_i3.p1 TRINITY_DN2902_c0_g1~~TRINITY_DN2902_c0_g1_i3.p1  ORF type:complete len:722 (+),score=104.05 TRINITY_DN2902_c0_g1_i3:205-2370(+)
MAERIYPRHEGFLYKRRRGPVARWKLCFLLTEGGALACFSSRPTADQVANTRKRIHLPSVELSVHSSGIRFRLHGPHCSMELRGETKAEADAWISALRQIIYQSVRRVDMTMSMTDTHTMSDIMSNYSSPTQSPSTIPRQHIVDCGFSVELSQQNLEYEISRLSQAIQLIQDDPTSQRLQEVKDASQMALMRSKEFYGLLSTTYRRLAISKQSPSPPRRSQTGTTYSSPSAGPLPHGIFGYPHSTARPALLEALREENEELRRRLCELESAKDTATEPVSDRPNIQQRKSSVLDMESTVYEDATSRIFEDLSDVDHGETSEESEDSLCLTHNYGTAIKTEHHSGATYQHTPVQSPPITRKPEYRTALPCPEYPLSLSLIDFLRSHLPHELPKVTLPISVHMPLTLLQVMCEDLEFSGVLDSASTRERPLDRMLFVCAFAVSNYSRAGKRLELRPFKPLLGETFEYFDRDKGIHFIAEHAQANPSISVCHAFCKEWVFERDLRARTKFWGSSIDFSSVGTNRVLLRKWGEDYTWSRAPVRVLQCPDKSKSVEVFGEIVVNCPKSGLTGHLEFLSTQDPLTPSREVRGAIMDAGGRVMATMHGHWESVFGFTRQDGGYVSLWTINYGDWLRHPFGMSDFSLQLNNQPSDTTSYPASDSRYRPDVRSFEMGCYEDAAALKKKVEAEKVGNPQKGPVWFQQDATCATGFRFLYEYWNARSRDQSF